MKIVNTIGSAMLILLSVTVSASLSAKEVIITQQDRSFMHKGSEVKNITVNTGDVIKFQNDDPFVHNIFSMSKAKFFDLGSMDNGDNRSVVLKQAGVVQIECAIHPQMLLEVTVE